MNKGPILKGKCYSIIRYQVYDAKGRCDICKYDHKAGKQALIYDKSANKTYQSGTSCLDDCLGYNEVELEKLVKGRRSIAARISHITQKIFEDESEMIESLILLFLKMDHRHSEVLKCISNLQEMKSRIPLTQQAEDRLIEIVDFHLILNEAIEFPELYRDRLCALKLDPVHSKDPPVNWELYKNYSELTVARIQRLKEVLKAAKKKRKPLNLPDSNFLPWDYPNEKTYLSEARRHYTDLADRGVVRPDDLQASYDFEKFNYEVVNGEKMRHPRRLEDFLGIVKVPGITPVLIDSRIPILGWESASVWRNLEKRHRLNHLSLNHAHHYSIVTHMGHVRTDAPEDRIGNNGNTRRVDAEDVGTTQFRCAVFWPTSPWKPIYEIWYKYSSKGGRDYLLSFPEYS